VSSTQPLNSLALGGVKDEKWCTTKTMAIKATIYKATVQLSDLDRQVYAEQSATIARHPSETDERMVIRLLAFGLNFRGDEDAGQVEFARDMWEPNEPALWQKDLTGTITHWIEVGQPDDRRIMRASSTAQRVTVYSFSSSTAKWWKDTQNHITRARNLSVWQIPADQSRALAELAQRSMRIEVTVQEGVIWVAEADRSVEVTPVRLYGEPDMEGTTR